MNRVITAFKKVRLRQILTTFLAGVLLFVSTACNSAGTNAGIGGNRQEVPSGLQSETGVQAKNPRPEVPDAATTNRFRGGSMNEFSDVDPRTKQTDEATTNKAASLKENAERNLEKRADSVEKYVENYQQGTPLGERVKRLGEDAGSSADDLKGGVSKKTQRGIENVKGSAQDATKEATKGVNRAGENVKESVRGTANDLNRSASRTVDKVADKAQRVAEDTPEVVQNKANEAGKKTSNFIQDKVNQLVGGTERNVNKAADAVKDAVD